MGVTMTLPARLAQVDTPRRFPRLSALAESARARAARAYLTADLRSLAAGRIALALVLLLDLAKRATEMGLWYTNDGLVPNHTLLWRPAMTPVFSLFFMASYRYEAVAGFLACAAAYTMLLVGFRTRFAQIASLVCLLSLHGRMLLIDNGGDVVLGLLTVWTTFLPTGRAFSVDAVLARGRTPGRPLQVVPAASGARPGSFASLGVLAIVFQLAFIYFFNAVHKQGTTWRDGSAVHYVLHLDRLVTGLGVWLRGMPTGLARALTYGTLAIEWSLPLLLLSPFAVRGCRRLAVVLVIMLHTGFALCMNLGNFVPAMIAYTPNFVRPDDWDALARWWSRRPRAVRLARATASLIERAGALLSPGRAVRVTEPGPWAAAVIRRSPPPSPTSISSRAGRCSPPTRRRPTTTSSSTRRPPTAGGSTPSTRSPTRATRRPASASRRRSARAGCSTATRTTFGTSPPGTRPSRSGSCATRSGPDGLPTRSSPSRCSWSRTTAPRSARRRRGTSGARSCCSIRTEPAPGRVDGAAAVGRSY